MRNKSPYTEEEVCEKLFLALTQIQSNPAFSMQKENIVNDGLRDRLSMVFDCYDQTRQGISENELDRGQVDILIKNRGIPFAIIESIRVKSVEKDRLLQHIIKVLTKYDQNGCLISNLVIYGIMVNFASFWMRLETYLKEINYPFPVEKEFTSLETGLAESKHGRILLNRNGSIIAFNVFAIHLKGENIESES